MYFGFNYLLDSIIRMFYGFLNLFYMEVLGLCGYIINSKEVERFFCFSEVIIILKREIVLNCFWFNFMFGEVE